jgi:hypothetical protein
LTAKPKPRKPRPHHEGGQAVSNTDKLKMCAGCSENFYNGNNDIGISRCWNLDSAKVVKKVRVGINERPPWTGPEVKVLSCRRERGVVLMSPESRDANNRACLASMAREAKP